MSAKRLALCFSLAVFLFVGVAAYAAGEQWFVIKDKNGVCKVISAKDKTPKTIAGPFSSKAKAEAAKEKSCGSASKAKAKKPASKAKAKPKAKPKETKKPVKKDKKKPAKPEDKKKK